jgi:hypothetical protein
VGGAAALQRGFRLLHVVRIEPGGHFMKLHFGQIFSSSVYIPKNIGLIKEVLTVCVLQKYTKLLNLVAFKNFKNPFLF